MARNCDHYGEPKHYYIFILIFVTNWFIHNVINSCKQWKNTPSKLQWTADTKTLVNTVSFIWWRISRWNYFLTFGKFNLVFISIYLFFHFYYLIRDLMFWCDYSYLMQVIFWGNVNWRPQKCSLLPLLINGRRLPIDTLSSNNYLVKKQSGMSKRFLNLISSLEKRNQWTNK